MIEALCSLGIFGFIGFLKSAVFAVRLYSRKQFISRAINKWRRKNVSRRNEKTEMKKQEIY